MTTANEILERTEGLNDEENFQKTKFMTTYGIIILNALNNNLNQLTEQEANQEIEDELLDRILDKTLDDLGNLIPESPESDETENYLMKVLIS